MIRVNQEIAEFKQLPSEFKKHGYFVTIKDEYAFIVSSEEFPAPFTTAPKVTKKYELFLSALIHGNEVGGIRVLNQFAKQILKERRKIPHSMFFCLGNIEAAQKGVRFIERDLNRSFLSPSKELLEEKLAQRIGNYAKDCVYCIDIHQTNQDCMTPFMIFFYTPKRMSFARHLDKDIPAIISITERHKDGSTLDYFCYKNNTVNATIELGVVGFHDHQTEFGVKFLDKFFTLPDVKPTKELTNTFKVKETVYWFEERILLNPGYLNFSKISKNEILGKKGKEDYQSPADGFMLFPKYGVIAEKTKEVFTIAQPITDIEDLKKPNKNS